MKKISSIPYPLYHIKSYSPSDSRGVECHMKTYQTQPSVLVQQSRFPKWEKIVRSCKFQQNCKLQIFILKLRVVNYELNLKLELSRKLTESKFETASF